MLQFQRGDPAAFDRIVLGYGDAVRRFIGRYLGDADRAEDLTQEVFLRVYRARHRYRPEAGFRTWLFTIASRLSLNEIRGVRRRRAVFAEGFGGAGDGAIDVAAVAVDAAEASPEARLEVEELETLLGTWIDELPGNQRAALLLSRMESLSYAEIAEALGVSVMAVKSLLMRARETLRRRLEPYLARGDLRVRPSAADAKS